MLGYLYEIPKLVLIVLALVFLFLKVNSPDYLHGNGGLFSMGAYLSEINVGDTSGVVKNEVVLGCNGLMSEDVLSRCKQLELMCLFDTIAVPLLLLSFVPKYGEIPAVIAAVLLMVTSIGSIMMVNTINEPTTEGSAIVEMEHGEGFTYAVLLIVLSLIIVMQSGYGLGNHDYKQKRSKKRR